MEEGRGEEGGRCMLRLENKRRVEQSISKLRRFQLFLNHPNLPGTGLKKKKKKKKKKTRGCNVAVSSCGQKMANSHQYNNNNNLKRALDALFRQLQMWTDPEKGDNYGRKNFKQGGAIVWLIMNSKEVRTKKKKKNNNYIFLSWFFFLLFLWFSFVLHFYLFVWGMRFHEELFHFVGSREFCSTMRSISKI